MLRRCCVVLLMVCAIAIAQRAPSFATDVQAKLDAINAREKRLIEKLEALRERERYVENQLQMLRQRKQTLTGKQVRQLSTQTPSETPTPHPQ